MSEKAPMPSIEAYKELIGLLKAEETLTWSRFQTFLTVNAGLLVLLGLAFPQLIAGNPGHLAVRVLASFVCVFGIAAAVLWLFVAGRSEAFYDHWFDQLRALENEKLDVRIFSTAEEYFRNGRARVGSEVLVLRGRFRRVRIFTASKIIAGLMVFAWVSLLGATVYELLAGPPPDPPGKIEIRISK